MEISAAADVKSSRVSTSLSALGMVHAAGVDMQQSAAGAMRAESVSMNGSAVVVIAGSVEMGNTYAGVVAGREVRGEKIESLILLSPKVEGNVSTVIDTRGALIVGLLGGLFAGIMLLLGQMLFGRKS